MIAIWICGFFYFLMKAVEKAKGSEENGNGFEVALFGAVACALGSLMPGFIFLLGYHAGR